jgi:hypothetical protein
MNPFEYGKIVDDNREAIWDRIRSLADSYTPEWIFDTANPDVGSVIAMLFADQTLGTIDRINQIMRKYRTEFANLMNVGLLPSSPASGIVVFDLVQDIISGTNVNTGCRLIGYGGSEDSPAVFETTSPLYVSNSRITNILAISGDTGRIQSFLESPKLPDVPGVPESGLTEEEPESDLEPVSFPEIPVFDFSKKGIEQNSLFLYHDTVFDVNPSSHVLVQPVSAGGNEIGAFLADPEEFSWQYFDGAAFTPYDEVSQNGGVISLRSENTPGKVTAFGKEYGLVRIDAKKDVTKPVTVSDILLSSSLSDDAPAFVNHVDTDLDPSNFMPFGEIASLFDDCYIGSDAVFLHRGATVTIDLSVTFSEKLVTFTPEEEQEQLKIIKRKPTQIAFQVAHTNIDSVAFDYFNGTGWRRIEGLDEKKGVFAGKEPFDLTLSFVCPEDWMPVTIGANTGRCLRVRVERADNCYLQPCLHRLPVFKGIKLSYSYEDTKMRPQRVFRISGTQGDEISDKFRAGNAVNLFEPISFADQYIYLGLNKKPEGSPIGLFFKMKENGADDRSKLRIEYGTRHVFKPMKVIDETAGLSRSGILTLFPDEDMFFSEVCGVSKCWIRLSLEQDPKYSATKRTITEILINAVACVNGRTMDEEAYYISVAEPNMRFPLPAENVLYADIYVNEQNLPLAEMRRLLAETPENVRASYDRMGNTETFYVKWEERENFDTSVSGDRHYVIDRLTGELCFGDGIHVRIPLAGDAPSVLAYAKTSDGEAGNSPPGALSGLMDHIMYIGNVSNPIATVGGSDTETVSAAVGRAAGLLNTRGRLISNTDFEREIYSYSKMIAKTHCAVKQTPGEGQSLHITVLMSDYKDGSFSFERIRDGLSKKLLTQCSAAFTQRRLLVREPVFVSIDTDIWLRLSNKKLIFETTAKFENVLTEKLDPLTREIGDVPGAGELELLIRGIRTEAVIVRFTATANYTDESGVHICDITELEKTDRFVGVSGAHKVHYV